MKPPLRSCGHRDAIVDALAAGTISAIATDHAPHPGSEKMQEFERCPFGIIGLETASRWRSRTGDRRQSPSRLVGYSPPVPNPDAAGTWHPRARAPGDVTIFSTDVEWTYDVNQSASRSRNSPFDGHTFRGGPMATVVNGEIKWQR